MPSHYKCVVCQSPLPKDKRGRRYCDDYRCWMEIRRRQPSFVEQEEVNAAIGRIGKHRRRSAAARGIPAHDVETYLPTAIPRNPARVSRLPVDRRRRFEGYLRQMIFEAQQRLRDGQTAAESAPLPQPATHTWTPVEQDAMRQLMIAGCAQCRGSCCMRGGTSAFHTVDTMMLYLQQHPDLDTEEIVAGYLSDLSTHTLTNGCVFQGERGCTLDANRRAPICHQYFCHALRSVQMEYATGEPVRVYYVQLQQRKIRRSEFVEVALSDTGSVSPQ